MYRLFVDMDGVVADLEGYLEEEYGVDYGDMEWRKEFWKNLDDASLFSKLEVTPHKDLLLEFVSSYPFSYVSFLSAVPHNDHMATHVMREKILWAKEHFPSIPVTFGPCSGDKWMHCRGDKDILIDDNSLNLVDWCNKGGIAFPCFNVYDLYSSIRQVESYLEIVDKGE